MMLDICLDEYGKIKDQLIEEIRKHPDREHELILLYSPVINYHAVKVANEVMYTKRLVVYK